MLHHLSVVSSPQLSKTNFSNNQDFRSFLRSLCDTFNEFKMHEQIENECIIGLLQQRSCTVYDVHSDNKLSEMLSLFEKGLCSVKVHTAAFSIQWGWCCGDVVPGYLWGWCCGGIVPGYLWGWCCGGVVPGYLLSWCCGVVPG